MPRWCSETCLELQWSKVFWSPLQSPLWVAAASVKLHLKYLIGYFKRRLCGRPKIIKMSQQNFLCLFILFIMFCQVSCHGIFKGFKMISWCRICTFHYQHLATFLRPVQKLSSTFKLLLNFSRVKVIRSNQMFRQHSINLFILILFS